MIRTHVPSIQEMLAPGYNPTDRKSEIWYDYFVNTMTPREIAVKHGLKPSSVPYHLMQHPEYTGIAQQRKRKLPCLDVLVKLHFVDKHSLADIAVKYDVDATYVSKVISAHPNITELRNARSKLPSVEELFRLYTEERMTFDAIGTMFNVDGSTISYKLRKYPNFEAFFRPANVPKLPPVEELFRLYTEDKLTIPAIAARFGVTHTPVHRALLKHPQFKSVVRPRGQPRKLPDIDELFRLYTEERLTLTQIGSRFKVQVSLVHRALHKHPQFRSVVRPRGGQKQLT
jgi:hypothetical protein